MKLFKKLIAKVYFEADLMFKGIIVRGVKIFLNLLILFGFFVLNMLIVVMLRNNVDGFGTFYDNLFDLELWKMIHVAISISLWMLVNRKVKFLQIKKLGK